MQFLKIITYFCSIKNSLTRQEILPSSFLYIIHIFADHNDTKFVENAIKEGNRKLIFLK